MMQGAEDRIQRIDWMRSITEYVNRAGFAMLSEDTRQQLTKMSLRQCLVLADIERYGRHHPEGIPMNLLAKRVGMTPSAASHMVDTLVRLEMVQRRSSEEDRRAVLVSVTEYSRRITELVERGKDAAVEELLKVLTPEERQMHESVIAKLYTAVQRLS